ncbi:bifunctional P-450/NADPH-P450 reductase [Diaporthe helianthi]|uniref:Bifunctional cytochrome P450/NADPH--P450 reductase n=1 Tax=Diaporthe helianthi TaxID=158607 RepID=A0A2P5HQL0_DIAHE|nr:bifunctional P-450/NADPH-P450 reductase [Diaporthe helianthi]
MADNTVPIPQPPGLPLLGNINDINPEFPLGSMLNMADKYGEIYRLNFPGRSILVVSSQALVNELCDEKRFKKDVARVLQEVRAGVHDGLFTAHSDEPNWGIAHRVLMPAFGPMNIQAMFPEMHDIANQLAMKWARHGPSQPIMVTDEFTRLTLDTLALCSMDYRFNSFYHDEMHPFIEAMADFLVESGNKSRRPPFTSIFYREADRKYERNIEILRKTADDVLQARKQNPTDRKDLLNAMLKGVDLKTGQKMTDQSITDNLITFLIAGHETTSGMLSFAFYNLLKNPETYKKAQQEVDEVVGTGPIVVDHVKKLQYIQAVLRETLRLTATIPVMSVRPLQDTVIGGKYAVSAHDSITLLVAKSQLDPAVFGETAHDFIPDRMSEDNFNKLNREFPNAWKPFGNGMRACIGRPFAWQEAVLVMAMLLQNFNFMPDDPNYHLSMKQTLTIKPKDFLMRASLRHGLTPTQLEHRLNGTTAPPAPLENSVASPSVQPGAKGKPMAIYYGSNSGTCEALAQRLASDAPSHGFSAAVIDSLDAANQNLPTDRPVAIITASYEGEPPDNAALFCNWIQGLEGKELENVSYAVFGCGHHDWSSTFHKIPKMCDATIEKFGGSRIAPMGVADAADGDMFTKFESWEDEVFWPAMKEKYGVDEDDKDGEALQGGLSVEISTPRSSTLRQDVKEAVVVETQNLTSPEAAPTKKHIEIQLPSDMSYSAGDYLAILPINPKDIVHRALRRFQLPWDAHITISSQSQTTLPTGSSVPASDVLGAYVELAQPATKRSVATLAEAAKDEETKTAIRNLGGDSYLSEVSAKRLSILDLLEKFPSVELPFATFLSLLPPMRVRQYSISSSPLWNSKNLTLTYAVLDAPALSGSGQRYVGVATSYLASLEAGDKLHVAIRPSHASFHLPVDGERTPVLCIAAGSGLAPFRGFIQERAAMLEAGRKLAPALLFFGCRSPDQDDLYREELDRWQAAGAVDVRRAYSRQPEASEGCVHVQDRLWHDRGEVQALWEKGAKIYVCGSRGVGDAVKEVAIKIYVDTAKEKYGKDLSVEEATARFDAVRNERFATDVFD